MDGERHQDSAINLSNPTSLREGKEEAMLNGETKLNGESNYETVQAHSPTAPSPVKNSSGLVGAAKRKSKSVSDTSTNPTLAQQPLLMMAAQHGLLPQQLQQLLQQQAPGADLQLMMQQQQSMMLQHQQQQQKLQEGLLHQLNEQLQLNFIQLSQLVQQQQQQNDKKASKQVQQQMQQLGIQQQQLLQQIQQIQLQQRQYLMAACLGPQLTGLHQGMMSPGEIQQLWKEVAGQTGLDENIVKNNLNGMSLPTSIPNSIPSVHNPNFMTNGSLPVDGFLLPGAGLIGQPPISIKHNETSKSLSTTLSDNSSNSTTNPPANNPLCRHNFCKWPGCDTHCEDYAAFIKHLNCEHALDDRSTAQARVQLQVVNQLEMQLTREKDLLQGMMEHLHMKPPPPSSSSQLSPPCHGSAPHTPHHIAAPTEPKQRPISPLNTPMLSNHVVSLPQLTAALPVSIPALPLPSPTMTLTLPTTPTSQISSQSMSQPQTPTSAGPIRRRVSDKCNLPISAEIQRNRDFYKNTDVRPPFTYASLIRQSIIESPHRQLTLNEIYQWFQNTFAYFRRNEATWKNAVRHNLSLHKCFMRVENVKGAVWTVDEIEFYRRRPQKMSGNMKSPSYAETTSFNESLNASLRVRYHQHELHGPLGDISRLMEAALGESSLGLMGSNNVGQDSAEDLSMKSNSNGGHDELYREEELMMRAIKQETEDDDLDQSDYMETEVEREIDQSLERDRTFDHPVERDEELEDGEDVLFNKPKTTTNGVLDLAVDSNTLSKKVNRSETVSNEREEDETDNPADEMVEDMGCFSLPRVSQEMPLPVPSSAVV
ncbi:forkhead box protein P1 isoform X2 [Patella vulgata]|uniref:forkhead box protein P1 isoform X2 n=1 Tax=Patella vulgata TaxID=6465 RepID=UPI002180969E|nr:forkhead box protein P1 isoform X2 [Patella vulgata]